MPDGKIWMLRNLNFVTPDGSLRADSFYGRLYSWQAAMGAVPDGWHLPTMDEWGYLAESVGGTKLNKSDWTAAGKILKAPIGWSLGGHGIDSYGFCAVAGGYWNSDNFSGVGSEGRWWTSTEYPNYDTLAYYQKMSDNSDNLITGYTDKSSSLSVRLIKDYKYDVYDSHAISVTQFDEQITVDGSQSVVQISFLLSTDDPEFVFPFHEVLVYAAMWDAKQNVPIWPSSVLYAVTRVGCNCHIENDTTVRYTINIELNSQEQVNLFYVPEARSNGYIETQTGYLETISQAMRAERDEQRFFEIAMK